MEFSKTPLSFLHCVVHYMYAIILCLVDNIIRMKLVISIPSNVYLSTKDNIFTIINICNFTTINTYCNTEKLFITIMILFIIKSGGILIYSIIVITTTQHLDTVFQVYCILLVGKYIL